MPRNQSTLSRYTGVVDYVLTSCRATELSQITPEQLSDWAYAEGATPSQRGRLTGLWSGQQEVSPQLLEVLHEIAWPGERERLLRFLGGQFVPSADLDALLESLAWT
jgi:hypothetical protein